MQSLGGDLLCSARARFYLPGQDMKVLHVLTSTVNHCMTTEMGDGGYAPKVREFLNPAGFAHERNGAPPPLASRDYRPKRLRTMAKPDSPLKNNSAAPGNGTAANCAVPFSVNSRVFP